MSLPFTMSRRSQLPAEQSTGFGAIAERFRRAGELERAVALCQEGLQKFPDHLSARVTLGWAFLDLGKHDEARHELERVIRRAPDNLAAIRGLAALHDRMENADVEHMEAGPTSWPPPSFAVPPVATQAVVAPEPTPEVHADATPEPERRLEDLPLFQAAAQQEQEEAFHQAHAYEAPVEQTAGEQEPFLPFEAPAAQPEESPAPVEASSIDDFDPIYPPAAATDEQIAGVFDEPIAPMAFEMPEERSASVFESDFGLPVAPEESADPFDVAETVHAAEPVQAAEPIRVQGPIQVAEPVQIAEPVQAAAPVQMSEPVQIAEPVIAESAHVAEPVHVTEPVQIAEPVQTAEPVQVSETAPVAEPVQVAAPVPVPQPVKVVAQAAPAVAADEIPELLELEPLLLTVDDEPRPAGSVTIEPVIDEPLTLDPLDPLNDGAPLTLDVQPIAVEDAATPPAPGSAAAHVVFPVRMQPAKPALAALEKLLRRVEDRKLAAIAGSIAS